MLLDLDGNAASLKTFKDEFHSTRLQVEIGQSDDGTWADIPGKAFAFMKVKKKLIDIAGLCRDGKFPYRALCIDSLTTLTGMASRMILQTHRGTKQVHDLTLDLGQYQYSFNEIGNVLQIFNSLPILTILIAHETTNEIDSIQSHEIMIPGRQFPAQVRAQFPEILYCKNVTTMTDRGMVNDFVLQTVKTAGATARSCLNIPDGTKMSLGMEKILSNAGVTL